MLLLLAAMALLFPALLSGAAGCGSDTESLTAGGDAGAAGDGEAIDRASGADSDEATPADDSHTLAAAPQADYYPALAGTVQRDVTYCTAGDVELKLDVYYPAGGGSNPAAGDSRPAVMYVHGGG